MTDVTAAVLSIGEETTTRALESIQRQALPPRETITIHDVSPFYRALNLAASKVTTEFFVQVDSDMILDEHCLEYLRSCMTDEVGIVMGHLRDPLMGRIGWVKLFRTKCFATVQYRDLIAQDVVFRDDILRHGWQTVYALRCLNGVPKELWHTFGDHRPVYTPLYTYSKYLLEGRRYRFRKAPGPLVWHFKQLRKSGHPAAFVAQIALAHGIFIRDETDLLKPYERNQDFESLEEFLAQTAPHSSSRISNLPAFTCSPQKTFQRNYHLGIELRQANAFPAFTRCMRRLGASQDPLAWVAKVALCHGLFAQTYDEKICESEYGLLRELLVEHRPLAILKGKVRFFISAARDFTWEHRAISGAKRLLKNFSPFKAPSSWL
jgi:hypothetical protein